MKEVIFSVKSKNNQVRLSDILNSSAKLEKEEYLIGSILFDKNFFIKYFEISRARGNIIENSFVPTSNIKFQENKIFVSLSEEFFNIDTPLYKKKLVEFSLKNLKYLSFFDIPEAPFALFRLSYRVKIRVLNSIFPVIEIFIDPFNWKMISIFYKKGLFKKDFVEIERIQYFDDKNRVFHSKM